jgi:hypothetical protein
VCVHNKKIYIMREKNVCVCVCVCVCVKNKYRDHGPPWIILMITKIHSERHKVIVYMITKIQRTTGTKNYGPLVLYVLLLHDIP